MDARLKPLASILSINAAAYGRAVDGVDQASAERRPNDRTNSLAYLACHTLDARYYLMRMCGHEMTNPWHELFEAAKDISTVKEYPPLYELHTVWDEVHEATLAHLESLSAADLDAETSHGFPIEDQSLLGVVMFLTFHETYHVGQMGIIRKFMGFDPVPPY